MAKKVIKGGGTAAPAAAPVAPPAATAAGRATGTRQKIDRNKFKFAVWVGSGARPKFWANSLAEINAQLATLEPGKIGNVHVGELRAAKTEVKVTV